MTLNSLGFTLHRTWKRFAQDAPSMLLGLLVLGGCKASQLEIPAVAHNATDASAQSEEARMWMTVGERRFAITLADSDAANAFAAQLPLALQMAELNGNEKHADLPRALPTDASRPGTIRSGDLMLYGSDTLVVFYAKFQSPYSYTRLGWVDDPSDLSQALGQGEARIAFTRD